MLGFIFGTVCLVGLVKVLRGGHGWGRGWHGCGHGCGGYGYGHDGGYEDGDFPGPGRGFRGFRGGGFGPRSFFLRALFERLETTPGQERAIVAALDELRENRRVVREELAKTREDLSQAVRRGLFDDAVLDETFARHDRLLAQLRVSFVEALKKVGESLDEPQRKRLASLLEGGGPRWGGPFRAWV